MCFHVIPQGSMMFYEGFQWLSCFFSWFVVTVVTGVLFNMMLSARALPWHDSVIKKQAPRLNRKKEKFWSNASAFRALIDPLGCLHLFWLLFSGWLLHVILQFLASLATWNHNSAQLRIKSYPNQNSRRSSANSSKNPKHVMDNVFQQSDSRSTSAQCPSQHSPQTAQGRRSDSSWKAPHQVL